MTSPADAGGLLVIELLVIELWVNGGMVWLLPVLGNCSFVQKLDGAVLTHYFDELLQVNADSFYYLAGIVHILTCLMLRNGMGNIVISALSVLEQASHDPSQLRREQAGSDKIPVKPPDQLCMA